MKLNINYLMTSVAQTTLTYGERITESVLNKILIVALLALGCLAAFLYQKIRNNFSAPVSAQPSEDRPESSPISRTHSVFEQAIERTNDHEGQDPLPPAPPPVVKRKKENHHLSQKLPSPLPNPKDDGRQIVTKLTAELKDPSPEVTKLPSPKVNKLPSPEITKLSVEEIKPAPTTQPDLDNAKKTIHYLMAQDMEEAAIIKLMNEDLPEDQCRAIFQMVQNELQENNPALQTQKPVLQAQKPVLQTQKPVLQTQNRKIDKPQQTIKYPNLLLAANGVNQYQAGGPAACTLLACHFAASKKLLSPEMIAEIITANKYEGEDFLDTFDCIDKAKLIMMNNDLAVLEVAIDQQVKKGLSAAVNTLIDEIDIGASLIIANGLSISMRKQGNTMEFFDSHGNSDLTHQGNAAYVQTFSMDQKDLIVDFLQHRFPPIGFSESITFYPFQA